VLSNEKCRTVPRRQCFEYNKKVCSMNSKDQPKEVSWENQKLERIEDITKER
jgi:hypothetical protein